VKYLVKLILVPQSKVT